MSLPFNRSNETGYNRVYYFINLNITDALQDHSLDHKRAPCFFKRLSPVSLVKCVKMDKI